MKTPTQKQSLLFAGIMLMIFFLASNVYQEVEAQPMQVGNADSCFKPLSFVQKQHTNTNILNAPLAISASSGSANTRVFFIIPPEAIGSLYGIKYMDVYYRTSFSGNDVCSIKINDVHCASTSNTNNELGVVTLSQCVDALDLEGWNTLELDCSQTSGSGRVDLYRLVHRASWNTCG